MANTETTRCAQCGQLLSANVEEPALCTECQRRSSAIEKSSDPAVARSAAPVRSARSILAACAAIVTITVAGFLAFPAIREELARSRPPGGVAPTTAKPKRTVVGPNVAAGHRAEAPANSAQSFELRVYRNGPGNEPIVAVTEPGMLTEYQPNQYASCGRLTRELVRQAVLMVARDRLNIPVRDPVIGEPLPAGAPAETAEVVVLFPNVRPVLQIVRGRGEPSELLLKKELLPGSKGPADYGVVVEALEALMKDGLPEVFRKLAVEGKAPAQGSDNGLPEKVDERLGKLSFTEQFAAIRLLHAASRANGATPARMEALSRAYANLGLLTEYQWDAASRAYKARAILYSQRLVASEPKSPAAFWHRAYATGLAGIGWWAAGDIKDADQFVKEMPEKQRPSPPSWLPLLQAYLDFAPDRLAAVKDGPDAPLAALLRLLTLEYPPRTDVAVRAARAVIEASPECFRAHSALCEASGVANLHVATTLAPEVLSKMIPQAIAALPGIPATAKEAAKNKDEAAMTQALDDAPLDKNDGAEPAWPALAKIVRETRFVFTYHRLMFMARIWAVPTNEYWDDVQSLVAKHRYRPFLESFVTAPAESSFAEFAAKLDTTDLSLNAGPLLRAVKNVANTQEENVIWEVALFMADWTVHDLSQAVFYFQDQQECIKHSRNLLAMNPNAPYGMAELIAHAWNLAEPQLEAWKKAVGDHPTLIAAMAKHEVADSRVDDAERDLKRLIKLSSDLWAFEALAEIQRKRGDLKPAKETLDTFLTTVEDHGLDHAKVRVAIANDLMSSGRLDDAWPYAEAAAQTGAGWAMTCAQNCAEGQQKWDVAENYARNSSERYPATMWTVWFLFCERTGHGDIAAARAWTKAAAQALLESRPTLSTDNLLLISYVEWICGDKTRAAEAVRRIRDDEGGQVYVSAMAAMGDLAGTADVRDAALDRFQTLFANKSPKTARIFQLVQEDISKKSGALDLKTIDGLLSEMPKETQGNSAFIVAAHLTAANRLPNAKRYWELVANARDTNYWWRVLALSALRELNFQPTEKSPKPREV